MVKPKRNLRLDGETLPIKGVSAPAASEFRPKRPSSELTPGALLGDYILGEVLGQGGMGTVYRAHDPDLGRDLAIKLVRPETEHPHARERLIREAKAMARVDHPQVITVYRVGTDLGRVYIAMELVEGGTIRDWLDSTPRSQVEIIDRFREAAEGLHAAHQVGLVHRDFKPHNVLIGSDGRVRVTDFGLAAFDKEVVRSCDEGAVMSSDLTATGVVMGTAAYMSPEQFSGGPVDARSDQFSFAVSLYEALCGHRPFAGDTLEELQEEIRRGEYQPGSSAAPEHVLAALRRALSVSPKDRFEDMRALFQSVSGQDAADARRTPEGNGRRRVDELRALYEAGSIAEGLVLVDRFQADMNALTDPSLLAEFAFAEGSLRAASFDTEADAAFERAFAQAELAGLEDLAARVAVERLLCAAVQGETATIRVVLPIVLTRIEQPHDIVTEARFSIAMALVNHRRGQRAECEKHSNHALEIGSGDQKSTALGMACASAHFTLALNAEGDHAKQAQHYLEAIRTLEALGVECHPLLAGAYNELGTVYTGTGHTELAKEHRERSLELFRRSLGARHPEVSVVLINLAENLAVLGQFEESEALAQEGLALAREVVSDPKRLSAQLYSVAHVHHLAGEGEVIKLLEECLELRVASYPPRSAFISDVHGFLGVALERAGDADAAYAQFHITGGLNEEGLRFEQAARAEFSMSLLCAEPSDALHHAERAFAHSEHPHIVHRLALILSSEGAHQDWPRVYALAKRLDEDLDESDERRADIERWLRKENA